MEEIGEPGKNHRQVTDKFYQKMLYYTHGYHRLLFLFPSTTSEFIYICKGVVIIVW
jgi:hypothetical protein